MDRRLAPRYFDNNEPLVSTRYQPVNGTQLSPGELISTDLGHSMRMRLWMSRLAVYQKDYTATAVAVEADQAAIEIATLEALPGGNYAISAPWLEAPIKIKGKAKAEAELERVNAEHAEFILEQDRAAIAAAELADKAQSGEGDEDADAKGENNEGLGDDASANNGGDQMNMNDESGAERSGDEAAQGAATTTTKGDELGQQAADAEEGNASGDVVTTQKGDELGAASAAE